mgnify:CR=1 FL=1
MIGDSDRDVEAGRNAGVKQTLKIEENKDNFLIEALNSLN